MKRVAIIGAGQAGLATAYWLSRTGGLDVTVFDKAERLGSSWRDRWDSLTLFTPAQYDGLPGTEFPARLDYYPGKGEVAEYLERYGSSLGVTLRMESPVDELSKVGPDFLLRSGVEESWFDAVVIATGPFQTPWVPPFAESLPQKVMQLHSSQYRSPAGLPDGKVVVVGGGNSGLQIAQELRTSHEVTVAIGKRPPHLPQRIAGVDLFTWLNRLGLMSVGADSRIGRRMRAQDPVIGLSVRQISKAGVRVTSRVKATSEEGLHLASGEVLPASTVVWATGFRNDYSWVKLPVLGADGMPIHKGGVTSVPGLAFVGLPWQTGRGSALLGWVGRDAEKIAISVSQQLNTLS